MPNEWGDEVATDAPATNEWGDVAADAAPAAAAAPDQSWVGDKLRRAAQGMVTGAGEIMTTANRVREAIGDKIEQVLPVQHWLLSHMSPEDQQDAAEMQQMEPGVLVTAAGERIPVDPARNKDVSSLVAGMAGKMVPVAAAAATGDVPALAAAAGAESSEETRQAALAAGDAPDVASAKGKLAAVPAAMLSLADVPGRQGAKFVERLVTRAGADAALNAGATAATQELTEGKVDWGQLKQAGAFGAGLGVVLHVPEAVALLKRFGPAAANVEGKTLGDAVQQIAQASKQDPTDIQRQINEAVGIRPAGMNEWGDAVAEGQGPTPTESAVRQADVETALATDQGEAVASNENQAKAEAAQAQSLFESSLARKADVEAALENPEAAEYSDWWQQKLAADDQLRQSPQATALLGQDLQAQADMPPAGEELNDYQKFWHQELDRAEQIRQSPLGAALLEDQLQAEAQGRGPEEDLPQVQPTPAAAAPEMKQMNLWPDTVPAPPRDLIMQSATGSIDPRIFYPLARSAIGGVLGYATGNTPEERTERALLGIGLGPFVSPALVRWLVNQVQNAPLTKGAAEWAADKMTTLRLKLAPESLLPPDIRGQLKIGEQGVDAITRQGASLSADLMQDIRGLGDKAVQGMAAQGVHEYLTGQRPLAGVAAPVRVSAEKLRNYVDSLSDRAVAEGVVQGKMAQTFLSNRGSYLRRSYDIFLDRNYQPDPADVDAAVQAVAKAQGIAPGDARLQVNDLLAKHNRDALPAFLMGQGKIGGKDVGSLVQRQDLLPEIRKVLGEVKDPVVAANQTIPRLAKLIEMDATQKNIRALGLRAGIFRDEAGMKTLPPAETGKWIPLVSDANKPQDNFRGLWARQEIAQAFQKTSGSGQIDGLPGLLWKAWTTAVATAKASKTVFNPESYAANFVGHAMMNVANGNFRYNHALRGLALGAEETGVLRKFLGTNSPTREALRDELNQLHQLGVFHESPVGEDLLKTIQQSFWSKMSDTKQKVISAPGKLYNEMFNFNRYVGWQSERARYAAAYPNKPMAEINRMAADVVNATTPTYSNVPKFVKQMSVAGITPSFINFPFEVFRNTFNTARIGRADIMEGLRTNNAALVKAGATRLAALTVMLAAGSGLGVSLLSRRQNNVTDQQDEATRFFGPPWNREGALSYLAPVKNGRAQFMNLEYLMPHAIVTQALDAAMRGAKEGEAAQSFLRALSERFVGNNILAGPLSGAITGFDPETGRPIPRTAVTPTLGNRADYLWHKAFEPLVIPWAQKVAKAINGEEGDHGQVFTLEDQMLRLAAVRSQTLDFGKDMTFKAKELGDQFNQATSLYRSRMKENLTAADLDKSYQNAEQARQAVFSALVKMRQLGNVAGVSDDMIVKAMKDAQIPTRTILDVMDNQYTPGDRGGKLTASEVLAALMQRPANERKAALADIYRQDPALANSAVEKLRQQQNQQGLSARDKLLLGLGVSDGARANYIRTKLQQLPDAQTKRQWLQHLMNHRILTNDVWQQMTQVKTGQN